MSKAKKKVTEREKRVEYDKAMADSWKERDAEREQEAIERAIAEGRFEVKRHIKFD